MLAMLREMQSMVSTAARASVPSLEQSTRRISLQIPCRNCFESGEIYGELMFTALRKHARFASRQPDHVAALTPTLSVSVWQSVDSETGGVRMHWDVSRIGSEDPSRTYRTLKIESLLEFPAFLSRVATGFAQTDAVGPQLRNELLQFAKDMELLAVRRDANGVDRAEKKEAEPIHF
jgi:hypothetical protein